MKSPAAKLRIAGLVANRHYSLVTNFILFISSLLLLIDLAPRDFAPSYRKRVDAISKLTRYQNIIGYVPIGVNIKTQNPAMSIVPEIDAYRILKDMVQEYSPYAGTVKWNRAIGIGYSTLRLPVGKLAVDAFHPLYIVETPDSTKPDELLLRPVGQLPDLTKWISEQHQSSMTQTAILLLVIGFFLQLRESWTSRHPAA
jgi:hypothetical protein